MTQQLLRTVRSRVQGLVRQVIYTLGLAPKPAFEMRRHPAGVVRERLMNRGVAARRFRHTSLQRLLKDCANSEL